MQFDFGEVFLNPLAHEGAEIVGHGDCKGQALAVKGMGQRDRLRVQS